MESKTLKPIQLKRVWVVLAACFIGIFCYFMPWGNAYGENLNIFGIAGLTEEPIITYIVIGSMVCYAGVAILFVTDHPKLALIPLVLAFFTQMMIMEPIADMSHSGWEEVPFWYTLQFFMAPVLLVMVFAVRKLNKKRRDAA